MWLQLRFVEQLVVFIQNYLMTIGNKQEIGIELFKVWFIYFISWDFSHRFIELILGFGKCIPVT